MTKFSTKCSLKCMLLGVSVSFEKLYRIEIFLYLVCLVSLRFFHSKQAPKQLTKVPTVGKKDQRRKLQ